MVDVYCTYADGELLRLLQANDEKAFTTLYERYWKDLYNTAYKRIKDHELCQDIIQELFADLWVRKYELEINNIPGYLHNAVRFQVFKAIARNTRNAHFMQLWQDISQPSNSADSRLHAKDFTRLIEEYLQLLPEGQRKAFAMRFIDEMSTAEVAATLNNSPKTVRNQSAKAMQLAKLHFKHLLRFFF